MPLPKRTSLLRPERKRTLRLDLSSKRSRAFERRSLSLTSKARLLAATRKQPPFAKKKKSLIRRLRRRV